MNVIDEMLEPCDDFPDSKLGWLAYWLDETDDLLRRLAVLLENQDLFDLVSGNQVQQDLRRWESELRTLREDSALDHEFGPSPTDAGGSGHEEAYWFRNKLNLAIRHLRDIEDYYRAKGGLARGFNMIRADRARDIYEQITEDFFNGRRDTPTIMVRLHKQERMLAALRPYFDDNFWKELEDG